MSRLINYESLRGEFNQSKPIHLISSQISNAGALDRERDSIYSAVRSMQDRLTEIEEDIGRFEMRMASRTSG